MTTAQNTYAGTKDLKAVKNDTEFVQYLVEMFTTDDEGIEHPEEIQIKAWRGHIAINLHGDKDIKNHDGLVVKCSNCGRFEILLYEGGSTWETEECWDCKAKFTKIGDCRIEQ